ncbi:MULTISPECIES: hypothetical protein [unclassified Arsenophonus]|uniref:hypothetical protein n=1 Tax=unclassified Arsenophonus TaxID=2627083 RepID=UPI00285F8E9C|nr:hypothetical protein [Arsenophonus sp.]MDR5610798.1 hypothetical protein [Arsenophonus sp.]MDR5614744.1 hypothetical protein [Arsenophonus sp.]
MKEIDCISNEEKEQRKSEKFIHIFEKTNFLKCFKKGLLLIGKPSLAELIS